jgi:A/G-specific adenine glycosylase
MPQHTQVKTVLPYFERWMKAFPSVRSLARASDHEVLRLWQGLGYYSRARNLKRAAAYLLERHGGRLPRTYEAILRVPGIGPYSAGAILSIAYGAKVPIADGNVLRVLGRVFAVPDPVSLPAVRERVRRLEEALLPARRPGEFNEALMELGALVCTPRNPACPGCPVRAHCRAFAGGAPEKFPVKTRRIPVQKVEACAVILEKEGKVLIRRRPVGRLMGGLWEFPEWKREPGRKWSLADRKDFIARTLGLAPDALGHAGTVRRHYTRFAETLAVFRADWNGGRVPLEEAWPSRWASPGELASYPLTSAHAKIRNLILARPEPAAV